MRRFDLPKRTRLLRRACGNNGRGSERAFRGLDEPERPPEECEVAFAPGLSDKQRTYVLAGHDIYCRMCGVIPGDIDDLTGRRVDFYIGLDEANEICGEEDMSNLRTLCSTCYQGAMSITAAKPTTIWLLSQVRRAGRDEQRAVLKWLREKFKV